MTELVPPTERTCERCGRHEEWSEEDQTWVVREADGDPPVGEGYCLHEWDIDGDYNPFPA